MPAPTLVNRLASVFNTVTRPKTAGAFTYVAGDILVCKAINENSDTFATPTGGTGFTWTQRVNIGTAGSNGRVTIWTGVSASSQSVTVSVQATTSNDQHGIDVEQWRDHSGVGQVWSGQIASGTGAPTATATSAGSNSAISMAVTDYTASATTGKTYRTANAGTFTETAATQVASHYTYYLGYHADSGAAASKTIGLSAPSAMRWTLGAVEILGIAGGTTVTLTPATESGAAVPRSLQFVRTLSPVAGTDAAQPVTALKTLTPGTAAVETGATVGLVAGKRTTVTAATESGTPVTPVPVKAAQLGLVSEAGEPQPLTARKTVTVTYAAETGAGQPVTVVKRFTVTAATESGVTSPTVAFKSTTAGPVAGAESPVALSYSTGSTVTLTPAADAGSAVALAARKLVVFQAGSENGIAVSVSYSGPATFTLTPAAETSSVVGVTLVRYRTLPAASETGMAVPLTRAGADPVRFAEVRAGRAVGGTTGGVRNAGAGRAAGATTGRASRTGVIG